MNDPQPSDYVQDYYPEQFAHCYGCGRLNKHGHQLKTQWDGEETLTRFTPQPFHIAIPGYVYGGLVASLIDCHSTGSAALGMYRHQGRPLDSDPPLRFVTASLKVDYLKPTPLGPELEVRGVIMEVKGRKVTVESRLTANGITCATGLVIAVQVPEDFGQG